MSGYLATCPDCVPLPTNFPLSCAPVLAQGARDLLAGKGIADPQCLAHCAYSIAGWGLGLWIGDHVHGAGASPVSVEAGLADLDKLASGKSADFGAINWAAILAVALKVLELIKPLIS